MARVAKYFVAAQNRIRYIGHQTGKYKHITRLIDLKIGSFYCVVKILSYIFIYLNSRGDRICWLGNFYLIVLFERKDSFVTPTRTPAAC